MSDSAAPKGATLTEVPEERRCEGVTATGTRCQRWAERDGNLCAKHKPTVPETEREPATGVELASIPGLVERLGRILADPQARDADVISAVRALADMAAAGTSTMPTTAARVQALTTDELHALVRHLEVAHAWPGDPEGAQEQALWVPRSSRGSGST